MWCWKSALASPPPLSGEKTCLDLTAQPLVHGWSLKQMRELLVLHPRLAE
jgi:hypothetical protein